MVFVLEINDSISYMCVYDTIKQIHCMLMKLSLFYVKVM